MKRISYIPLIALAFSSLSLHAMSALKAKQEQIAKGTTQPTAYNLLPEPMGAPVGDTAFYQEIARLKKEEISHASASWIARALYAVQEIKKLDAQLNQLRKAAIITAQEKAQNALVKQKIKDTIMAYAQAALTGYNNNPGANTLYQSNAQNVARFNQAYEFLKTKSGWWTPEIWWRSTDK